jgi:hypothetical protein
VRAPKPRRAPRSRRGRVLLACGLALLGLGAFAAAATALHLQVGDIVVEAEGGFAPKALPPHHDAPITLHGGGSISTASGELPPILKELTLLFDRHGSVETTGLAVCTKGRLAATTVAAARAACPNAIVGEGSGTAIVKFPEQAPIRAASPITLFNGPPMCGRRSRSADAQAFASPPHARTRSGGHAAFMKDPRSTDPQSQSGSSWGSVDRPLASVRGADRASTGSCDPSVLAHAYLSVPAPTTYIVPIVIERVHKGAFGYRTKATIPKIAGGYGIPISGHFKIGKKWTYKGRHYSYVNARCETGKLQAQGQFTFSDGTLLEGTFLKPCEVRR